MELEIIEEFRHEWNNFNIKNVNKTLLERRTEIEEIQSRVKGSKKNLIVSTKDFKAAEEVNKDSALELIQHYQNFADLLMMRCKTAEASFLTSYQVLSEIPDPLVTLTSLTAKFKEKMALEVAVEQQKIELKKMDELLRTNKELEQKVRNYSSRIETLKAENEAEITQAESALIQEHEVALEKREEELDARLEGYDKLIEQYKTEQIQLNIENQELRAKLSEFSESNRVELNSKNDALVLMEQEFQQMKEAYARLEVQCSMLKNEKEELEQNGNADAQIELKELKEKLSNLQAENEEKQKLYTQNSSEIESQVSELQEELRVSQEQLNLKEQEIENLNQSLKNLPSMTEYHYVKHKLSFYQTMESKVQGSDESELDADALLDLNNMEIEDLKKEYAGLVKRLQKSQNENGQLEDKINDLTTEMKDGVARLVIKEDELNRSHEVNAQLERKLLQSIDGNSDDLREAESLTTESSSENTKLEIMQSQRDRFQQLYSKTEMEKHSYLKTIEQQQLKLDHLRGEMVLLKEKLRFSEEEANQPTKRRKDVNEFVEEDDQEQGGGEESDLVTNSGERRRNGRIRNQNPRNFSFKMFITNRYFKKFLIIYSLFLHLLVGGILYLYTTSVVDTSPSASSGVTPKSTLFDGNSQ